jgi:hypothetical protein
VLVLDGPLYYTPSLLVQFRSMIVGGFVRPLVHAVYVMSYLAGVLDRFHSLPERTVVVGVSKRVNRSRMLSVAVRRLYNSHGGIAVPTYDPALAYELARPLLGTLRASPAPVAVAVGPVYTVVDLKKIGRSVAAALNGGGKGRGQVQAGMDYYSVKPVSRGSPLLTNMSAADLLLNPTPPILVKRSYYLYVGSLHSGLTLVRVEFPWAGGMAAGGGFTPPSTPPPGDLEVLEELAWLTSHPYRLPAPLPVAAADRVAKHVSRLLAGLWYRSLSGRIVFSYETLLQLAQGGAG